MVDSGNSNVLHQTLNGIKSRLFDLSKNNPFINVKRDSVYFLDEENKKLEKFYRKASHYFKEYGLETTLLVHSFLRWKDPDKDFFYTSPLVVENCTISRKRKIETSFEINENEDQMKFVNPILIFALQQFYDVELKDVDIDQVESLLCSELSVGSNKIKVSPDFNQSEAWQIINKKAVGNFNYKKSLLGNDFDFFIEQPNSQIKQVLGFEDESNFRSENLIAGILPLDFSQKEVIEKAQYQNLVIQGPPGTGKSHTILGLIGNYLQQNKKVLFVSQKRSALDVVYDRISNFDLNHLVAYLNTEKDEKKTFYKKLKSSWESYSQLEPKNETKKRHTDSSLLDFYLDGFIRQNTFLGCRPIDLVQELSASKYLKEELVITGKAPDLKSWQSALSFLSSFEEKLIANAGVMCLAEASFINLNKSVFAESDPLTKLEQRLEKCISILNRVNENQKKYGFDLSLTKLSKIAIAASILNMVNRVQLDLLNSDSKKYKSFASWAKKYELLKKRLKHTTSANSKWVVKPTKSEINELIDLLKHSEAPRGIFGLMKRRNPRLSDAFQSFDPNITNRTKIQLLEQLRDEWNLIAEIDEIEVKLKHNFGIIDPENEINQILNLRNKLSQIEKTDYLQILDHDESINLINDFANLHPDIQNYNHLVKFIFDEIQERSILHDVEHLKQTVQQIGLLKIHESDLRKFFHLPVDVQGYIKANLNTIDFLDACCKYHQLLEAFKYESRFSDLNGPQLMRALKDVQNGILSESKDNREKIKELYVDKWKTQEDLLATPTSKLKTEDKERKKQLKSQKRVFIHEINKKQRHLSVKQFNQENWDFVSSITPLWIMNPLSVSGKLPLVENLFDIVIFDEASQIPLEDALPAIYRAKQVIVVGDEHQMPPSSFFTHSASQETVLDQASAVFKSAMLKWHYRSEHPALIHFSNQYFYENELLTIPSAESKVPISFIHCQGVYENNINKFEAKEIVDYIQKNLKTKLEKTAVVAFSKSQEKEIRNQLIKSNINVDQLLITNLENVQGIERDSVIISIGYAKNNEGQFRMNFGPVNQTGGRNRLNVLFSRAKKEMLIFSSVKAEDFGLSDNPGVTCLKDFLFYAENTNIDTSETSVDLDVIDIEKYNLKSTERAGLTYYIQEETGKVILIDPTGVGGESKDLVTTYSLLMKRFSEVKIMLTLDYFNNRRQFKYDMDVFLKKKGLPEN